MSYGIKSYDHDRKRLTIQVGHTTPGRDGTRIETDAHLHLCPNAVEPGQRVSVLGMDLWELYAASVPGAALELARVLARIAAGLREGPDATHMLLCGEVPRPDATRGATFDAHAASLAVRALVEVALGGAVDGFLLESAAVEGTGWRVRCSYLIGASRVHACFDALPDGTCRGARPE